VTLGFWTSTFEFAVRTSVLTDVHIAIVLLESVLTDAHIGIILPELLCKLVPRSESFLE